MATSSYTLFVLSGSFNLFYPLFIDICIHNSSSMVLREIT